MKIRKNDSVIIIAGNAKGKTGKVLKVFPKENKMIVEGVNFKKRHTKPNQKNPKGGIFEKEAPVNSSNVMILDPKGDKPTRIGKKIIIDEKTGKAKRVRIARSSKEMLA
ncbi:MAG: 50S ribosomal protein L24 [Ignavibacteria bacterium]